jgi:hypothetical protein
LGPSSNKKSVKKKPKPLELPRREGLMLSRNRIEASLCDLGAFAVNAFGFSKT